MIKNIGMELYQRFPIHKVLWANFKTGEIAIQMRSEAGRVIISIDKDSMTNVFAKLNYVAMSGQFINIDKIDKVQRINISGNVLYNIMFEDTNVNDNIMITVEDFEKLKEKFIIL